jgi:hypothetical protein
MLKLFYTQLRLRVILRTPSVLLHVVDLTHVRRYLFTHCTLETLLNHVFEDLWKPKAPNNGEQDRRPTWLAPVKQVMMAPRMPP